MKLKGKSAVITGASQGLGKEIASHFVREGASVSVCARSAELLEKTLRDLSALKVSEQVVVGMKADVSVFDDVKAFTDFCVKRLGFVDCLVNNAGIYGPKGMVEHIPLYEWESTFHINVMGTLMMCKEFIPYLRQRNASRIINLSGGGATNPLPGISAYAATKAAVVRLTETLALELKSDGIFVNAVAPGALNTRLLDEIIEEGKDKVPASFYEKALEQKRSGGTPLNLGAELCVYLASDESNGITGKLISAVWDDWKNLHHHLEALDSDIYTLRRIVPEDRNIAL